MNNLFDDNFVHKHQLALLQKTQIAYEMIGSEPIDWQLIQYISFYYEAPIILKMCSKEEFQNYLNTRYPKTYLAQHLDVALKQFPENVITETDTEDDQPITHLAYQLIEDAIQKQASDIHIEAIENNYLVRFRCDGILQIITNIPTILATRLLIKYKIMAQLNIAERRLPQDGRMQYKIDIRVSTCPTLYGEKIVLRLLHNNSHLMHLENLGFSKKQLTRLHHALFSPQGMIIMTGPTGSGKTSTLYACLNYINDASRNIISIENPVELRVANVNQINCHEEIGLNFLTILTAILRQDPDVIMIGEIRDRDTALVALQAAQTGHLILTSLHSKNAANTYERLRMMGIPTHDMKETITLIIAQRLLRALCESCKQPNPENVGTWNAVGCEQCINGYKGRVGVYEFLSTNMKDSEDMARRAKSLIHRGITTSAEVERVLGYGS